MAVDGHNLKDISEGLVTRINAGMRLKPSTILETKVRYTRKTSLNQNGLMLSSARNRRDFSSSISYAEHTYIG